jgi:hypothetical protein
MKPRTINAALALRSEDSPLNSACASSSFTVASSAAVGSPSWAIPAALRMSARVSMPCWASPATSSFDIDRCKVVASCSRDGEGDSWEMCGRAADDCT